MDEFEEKLYDNFADTRQAQALSMSAEMCERLFDITPADGTLLTSGKFEFPVTISEEALSAQLADIEASKHPCTCAPEVLGDEPFARTIEPEPLPSFSDSMMEDLASLGIKE